MLPVSTKEKVLKHLFGLENYPMPTGVKVVLATAFDPTAGTYTAIDGAPTVAVTATDFAVDATKKTMANNKSIAFTNMPACTVTHYVLADGAGVAIDGAAVATPKEFLAGDTAVFNTGNLSLTINDV